MNRLKNQRCYLCGAMEFTDDNGAGWRNDITPLCETMGIVVINPINKQIKGFEEDTAFTHACKLAKDNGDWDIYTELMKPIRHSDLRLVDISDFLIVVLDLDHYPCGTMEELFWANRSKKPILVLMKQGKAAAPGWLFATIPHQMIFSTWEEMLAYMVYIDSADKIDDLGRWLFPEWD